MPIDRDQLERLLAERPATQRSAMQAVRDGYDDITLMRERGLAWAGISEVLARLGVLARDNQPISPVTLRSAYFLVGNEGRDDLPPSDSSRRPVLEAILAESKATVEPEPEELDALPEPDAGVAVARVSSIPPDSLPSEPVTTTVDEPEDAVEVEEEPSETLNEVVATVPNDVDNPSDDRSEEDAPTVSGDRDEVVASVVAPPHTETDAETAKVDVAGGDTIEADMVTAGTLGGDLSGVSVTERESPAAVIADASIGESEAISLASTNARGHRMLGTIFVLNDRGGVGKTLLSHHLMATAMLQGLELKVVEYEVNERLARLFGPEMVEHRRITQDFMNLMGSGDGFYEFWDQIGPELQRGGRLFDFGGNISQWFFNWAEVSGFDYYVGEGERLTFMVPVTVDLASLSTGMATLDRIAAIAPKAKRVLVENGVSGPFHQLEDSQYGRRKAELVEREGVDVIAMPPCAAPAWARLTGHRIDQVARMTREDLVKLGMTPPVASRSLIIIHDWLRGMREALAPYVADAFRVTPTPPSGRSVR